jgi:hypothetical protein
MSCLLSQIRHAATGQNTNLCGCEHLEPPKIFPRFFGEGFEVIVVGHSFCVDTEAFQTALGFKKTCWGSKFDFPPLFTTSELGLQSHDSVNNLQHDVENYSSKL